MANKTDYTKHSETKEKKFTLEKLGKSRAEIKQNQRNRGRRA